MKIKRWKLGFNLLMLTGLAGGCASMGDFADERLLTARFTSGANQAFGSYEATQGAPIPCRNHFADGFKAGYLDVANGGKGCPPVVPPKRYWSACYMTPKGQQAAQQWFAGFVLVLIQPRHRVSNSTRRLQPVCRFDHRLAIRT